jgi:hypothetical protein
MSQLTELDDLVDCARRQSNAAWRLQQDLRDPNIKRQLDDKANIIMKRRRVHAALSMIQREHLRFGELFEWQKNHDEHAQPGMCSLCDEFLCSCGLHQAQSWHLSPGYMTVLKEIVSRFPCRRSPWPWWSDDFPALVACMWKDSDEVQWELGPVEMQRLRDNFWLLLDNLRPMMHGQVGFMAALIFEYCLPIRSELRFDNQLKELPVPTPGSKFWATGFPLRLMSKERLRDENNTRCLAHYYCDEGKMWPHASGPGCNCDVRVPQCLEKLDKAEDTLSDYDDITLPDDFLWQEVQSEFPVDFDYENDATLPEAFV